MHIDLDCAFTIDGGAPTTVSDPEFVRVLCGLPVGGVVNRDMGAHGVFRLERVS